MKLDEYIEREKTRLDNFKKLVLTGHATDPGLWPLEMDEADWEEQFFICVVDE